MNSFIKRIDFVVLVQNMQNSKVLNFRQLIQIECFVVVSREKKNKNLDLYIVKMGAIIHSSL
jgi:hypothetical protein